jgi:hypothetical protein
MRKPLLSLLSRTLGFRTPCARNHGLALARAVLITSVLTLAAALVLGANRTQAQTLNCGTTTKNCHPLQVGVNEDWAALHSQASELGVANRVGLDWLRFPWSWADTQPNGPDDWNWDYTDRIMDAAQAAGEKVIFKPQGSPCWAHPSVPCTSSSTVPPDPDYLAEWQDYIRAVLQRYPGTIVAVEVWNEPNLRPFWDAPISPDRYAQVLRSAYTAVKSVDAKMPVVSGGLAAMTSTTATQMDYRSFLTAALSKGTKGYLDAVAIHPYPNYQKGTYLNELSTIVGNVRSIVGSKLPIWVTEFGYPTPTDADEQQQSTQITQSLNLLAHTQNVPVAIVHRMLDKSGGSIYAHYGLVRADYSPKPSYCAVGVWTYAFATSADCSIATQPLSLTKTGGGRGTVTSSPSEIDCDPSCTGQNGNYPTGTQVTLTAAPASGSTFAGWSGACSGASQTCTVTMDKAQSVEARFTQPTSAYLLYVNKAGGGLGTVVSSPDGINCGPDCPNQAHTYPAGTQVTLTATAASGNTFYGWSNACSGTTTCTVTMDADKYVGAWFGPA